MLSQSGDCVLLLDNFPAGSLSSVAGQSTDRAIEEVVGVILDFCPSCIVIMRARRSPLSHAFPVVELKSLDEADLRTYVMDHERGGGELASASAIGMLLRHTDGVPTQIDRSLRDLEVITLSELVNTDADVTVVSTKLAEVSPALAKSLLDLSTSTDATQLRSYSLLKALSLFPQGEQLSRIKRFSPVSPFFPIHATELLDRALIEVTTTQELGSQESTFAKTLVAPRPIRECIRDLVESDEVIQMNRRAAEIYFGYQWTGGVFKFPTPYRFDEPHCAAADIANANTIILRLLKEAVTDGDSEQISRVLGLAEFYLKALCNGNHYRSAMVFCDEFVPLIPKSGFSDKRAMIRKRQAQSLRMVGEDRQCKSVVGEIIDYQFSKEDRQDLLLTLALSLQSLGENDEARRTAEKIIRVNRHSNSGLQAQALLIELEPSGPERTESLVQLEDRCRKQKVTVVANNIAILRAREEKQDPDRIRDILLPVVKQSKKNPDSYNKMRAAIRLAELSLKSGENLREVDLRYLVGAYHFLFNERLPGLFDRCHESLWTSFDRSGQVGNLLTLFRYSSLYWRLTANESQEKSYLKKLVTRVGDTISEKLSTLSREAAYFLVRAGAQALTSKVRAPGDKPL
jgi:hypothetical protein